MRIGIREAKANLSSLLKKVQDGAEIIITDRGKPVGKIIPVTDESLTLYDRLKTLEEQGIISPSNKDAGKLPPPLPLQGDIQMILREDRRDE